MALTHSDIAPAANRGEFADAGNLYTFVGAPGYYESAYGQSWMPRGMAQALDALAATGTKAEQTIVSFNTPIAMKFGDVWIMAESNYSARTSQQISKIGAGWNQPGLHGSIERVPFDVSATELRRIIERKMRFIPGATKTHPGKFVPGPNYIAD